MNVNWKPGTYVTMPRVMYQHYMAIKGFDAITALLYSIMVDYANEDEGCIAWPKITTLEKELKVSENTVRQHLRMLVKCRLLEPVNDGSRRSNVYRVHMPLSPEEFARKFPDVVIADAERNARIDKRERESKERFKKWPERKEQKKKERGKRGRNGLVRNADEQKSEERKPAEGHRRENAAPTSAENDADVDKEIEELAVFLFDEPKHPAGFENAYDAYYMNEKVRRTRFHDGDRYRAKDGYYIVDGKRHVRLYDVKGKAVVSNPEKWLAKRETKDVEDYFDYL